MKKFLNSLRPFVGRSLMVLALLALVGLFTSTGYCQADVTDIVDGASSTFTAVAAVCVTMGVFFIGYRIAKRIR